MVPFLNYVLTTLSNAKLGEKNVKAVLITMDWRTTVSLKNDKHEDYILEVFTYTSTLNNTSVSAEEISGYPAIKAGEEVVITLSKTSFTVNWHDIKLNPKIKTGFSGEKIILNQWITSTYKTRTLAAEYTRKKFIHEKTVKDCIWVGALKYYLNTKKFTEITGTASELKLANIENLLGKK